MLRVVGVVARCSLAIALIAAALATPTLGFGACEYYEGRTFYGVIESDWLMAAALLGGGACAAVAIRLLRSAAGR